jgi:hypothetical protein
MAGEGLANCVDGNYLLAVEMPHERGGRLPVTEPGRDPGEIHYLAGNVQVWCCDGPAACPAAPAARWLHGAAWNTPGTPEERNRPRSRHPSGASRGVGIRLVRDRQVRQPAAPAASVADALIASGVRPNRGHAGRLTWPVDGRMRARQLCWRAALPDGGKAGGKVVGTPTMSTGVAGVVRDRATHSTGSPKRCRSPRTRVARWAAQSASVV